MNKTEENRYQLRLKSRNMPFVNNLIDTKEEVKLTNRSIKEQIEGIKHPRISKESTILPSARGPVSSFNETDIR